MVGAETAASAVPVVLTGIASLPAAGSLLAGAASVGGRCGESVVWQQAGRVLLC